MADEHEFVDVEQLRCCPRCSSAVKGTYRPIVDGAAGLLETPASWREFTCKTVAYANGTMLNTRRCDRQRKRNFEELDEMKERRPST